MYKVLKTDEENFSNQNKIYIAFPQDTQEANVLDVLVQIERRRNLEAMFISRFANIE